VNKDFLENLDLREDVDQLEREVFQDQQEFLVEK
jgi:hypothetical protein